MTDITLSGLVRTPAATYDLGLSQMCGYPVRAGARNPPVFRKMTFSAPPCFEMGALARVGGELVRFFPSSESRHEMHVYPQWPKARNRHERRKMAKEVSRL